MMFLLSFLKELQNSRETNSVSYFQYRIYVWSDEDLMDQPTIHTIYDELDKICFDPTRLIFLNTFRKNCSFSTFFSLSFYHIKLRLFFLASF